MKDSFSPISRWVFLFLVGLFSLWLSACADGANQALVEPAPDRPTFVWIFSDP